MSTEVGEALLEAVAQGVSEGIVWHRLFAIGLGRDHWCPVTLGSRFANMVAVIASVSQEHARRRRVIIEQSIEALEAGDLTSGYFRPDTEAVSVGNEVDFGCEATF